jgi:hypothetical protein
VAGEVVRRLSRGHFTEVVVYTPLGTVRSYVPADGRERSDRVGVSFGRMLLYQSGRLIGATSESG